MFDGPRYNSGTSLTLTEKERRIESLERALQTDFDDETFISLKKLPLKTIKALHVALNERLTPKKERKLT